MNWKSNVDNTINILGRSSNKNLGFLSFLMSLSSWTFPCKLNLNESRHPMEQDNSALTALPQQALGSMLEQAEAACVRLEAKDKNDLLVVSWPHRTFKVGDVGGCHRLTSGLYMGYFIYNFFMIFIGLIPNLEVLGTKEDSKGCKGRRRKRWRPR